MSINKIEILKKVTPLIENTLMQFGFIPLEIDFVLENNRWILKVFIFSQNKSITLDDCEKVSGSLSGFLDELIDTKYYLEVSSPGLNRKIKSDKEYIIFKGRDIEIKLKNNDKYKDYKVIGKIVDYNTQKGLEITELDTNKKITLKLDEIKSSKLYINYKTLED